MVVLSLTLLLTLSFAAPTPLPIGGGVIVELTQPGQQCVLQVDVPAKWANNMCRLLIRTQSVDDSLFGSSSPPEFQYLWRYGSAMFNNATDDIGKLANTGDRDSHAYCKMAGTYYLGIR